ncbi:hypothetical protein [Streptomyces sp. NPDC091215]|uniref:hypothetical protein n=1 Tax=Streptomyces sp. NPDC091215 TaxID=3155192 RepID=UPI00343C31AC
MTSHDDLRTMDGDVFVSPRHLASTTGVGDSAFAPLIDLGWDLDNDDLGIMWNQVCQGSLACRLGRHDGQQATGASFSG